MDGLLAQEVHALFAGSDWDQDGLLQGNEAISFFQRTGLPERQLRRVRTHAQPQTLALVGCAHLHGLLGALTGQCVPGLGAAQLCMMQDWSQICCSAGPRVQLRPSCQQRSLNELLFMCGTARHFRMLQRPSRAPDACCAGQIWDVVKAAVFSEGHGLSLLQFAAALRLVAAAQQGTTLTDATMATLLDPPASLHQFGTLQPPRLAEPAALAPAAAASTTRPPNIRCNPEPGCFCIPAAQSSPRSATTRDTPYQCSMCSSLCALQQVRLCM